MPAASRSHLAHACLSDILVCVVVEGGPNAAQAPRWVRNKEAGSGMRRLEVSDRSQTVEVAQGVYYDAAGGWTSKCMISIFTIFSPRVFQPPEITYVRICTHSYVYVHTAAHRRLQLPTG